MRSLALVPILLLAACATTREPLTREPSAAERPAVGAHRHGHLVGLGTHELHELFGPPTLQVREGPGLKLQYRGHGCVLDAYLYPPADGAGIERVTHVDARLASGADTDSADCEAAIESAR
ncbi:MAG: hypothetical protein ABR588_00050 [Sphingomicrobium sp.]